MIFQNPPLVEIVAELRWLPWPDDPKDAGTPGRVIQFPLLSPQLEEAFTRFSNKVAEKGFVLSERLSPVGVASFPFSPVYRFRKPPGQEGNFLYQIGAGLFSANALPPYRDWNSFKPVVEQGVQALLDSRLPDENRDFTHVVLRYIDNFSPEYTDDLQGFRFVNDILGIKVAFPPALAQQTSDFGRVQLGLQLSIPLNTGLSMNLSLLEGAVGGKNGIIMSTEVVSLQVTSPYIFQIMETFEKAHTSIRETFLGLTQKLRDKLQPVE